MTTNPTPVRGEVWRIRFDPSEVDEIKKVRTAVVVSENAVGRLRGKRDIHDFSYLITMNLPFSRLPFPSVAERIRLASFPRPTPELG